MRKLLFIIFAAVTCSLFAEIKMPAVFNDGMVLQREAPVPVWGWGSDGAAVSVSYAGQKKTTTCKDGKWMVKLDPLKASANPAEMTIKVGEETKSIKDILVGEVWLCGGQSNMDYTLQGLTRTLREEQYKPLMDYIKNEIATAEDPLLRHFKVRHTPSLLEEKTDTVGTWVKSDKTNTKVFTATGYFFAKELRRELGVPVALLSCNWGGTRVEAWIPMDIYQQSPEMEEYYKSIIDPTKAKAATWDEVKAKANYQTKLEKWKKDVEKAKAEKKKPPRRPRMATNPARSPHNPATLFNGMTYSLVPYAIKGALWYQGESNAGHYPDQYRDRFSAMINAWRDRWAQKNLYFYWCQLAQFKAPNAEPLSNDGWVAVCDHQRLAMSLPDTGMAVLNDIGEARDIHPHNKMDAGKRLSLWALKQAYGRDLVYSGPLYRESKIAGNKIVVKFDSVGSGLMTGSKNLMDPVVETKEPLKRFQICGADNKWKWAEAKIVAKDTVEVSHPDIAKPVEVRYAWSPNAEGANLYNKEGLPASLFKTK